MFKVRLPCPSLSPGVCSNSYPLSQWCHLTISSSVTRFSSCPQSFPASGSFPMNWLFASSGQSIGVSASTSVLPMNIQDWFPLGLTGLISDCLRDSHKSSLGPQFESFNSSVLRVFSFFFFKATWVTSLGYKCVTILSGKEEKFLQPIWGSNPQPWHD